MLSFNRALVVVAHPDDEILGCGGFLTKSANQKVKIVFVSEGSTCRFDDPNSEESKSAIIQRTNFAKSVIRELGFEEPFFHNLPCGLLDQVGILEINKIFEKHIFDFQPDLVISHSENDANSDHRRVAEASIMATRPGARNLVPTLLQCEILSSSEWAFTKTFQPNLFLELSQAEVNTKIKLLSRYESEIRNFPFPRSAEGVRTLASFRGMQSGVKYAEAFKVVRHIKLNQL